MIEVRFHGRGGQGAVTAAELAAQAVINEGRYAQGFPNFGPERRGAPVTAFLRVSETPIYLREKIEQPDVVVVLDASLLDMVDVCHGLKPGGILVLNGQSPDIGAFTDRYQVAIVDAGRIAMETIGVPITNTAIIGALIKASPLAKPAAFEGPMTRRFGRLAEKNLAAMNRAYTETILSDPPEAPPAETEDGPVCKYEDLLQQEALHRWDQLDMGCDILRPGSSMDFETGNWRTAGRPKTHAEKCIKCGFCAIFCPDLAYTANDEGYFDWNGRYCKGCGICVTECPKDAIEMREES